MYQYKFSIVMAVYNVEQFLEEAIDSVIKQDIGFKDNVQLILVDDGSVDQSGVICDKYYEKYSNNIKVIHKENGGVSSARNEGLKHVLGKYINFLDSDDTLSPNTLRLVYDFFEKNSFVVDLVSIPIIFFEGQTGEHILNYKYKNGTRVIDLEEEYDCIQLSLSSAFVKTEVAKDICFDTRLKFAEDAKECIKILLQKKRLGVVSEARYNYRKRRRGQASALQTSKLNKAWYMPYLNYFSRSSLKKAQETCGTVPKFVQFTVMYDIQWRFKVNLSVIKQVIGDEAKDFINACYDITDQMDDEIVLNQRHIGIEEKIEILSHKYNTLPRVEKNEDGCFCVKVCDTIVYCFSEKRLYFDFLTYDEVNFYFEGCISYEASMQSPLLCAEINGRELSVKITELDVKSRYIFDKKIMYTYAFKCAIPKEILRTTNIIKFYTLIGDKRVYHNHFVARKHFPLVESFDGSHITISGFLFTMNKNCIIIETSSRLKSVYLEARFLKYLLTCKRLGSKKAFAVRLMYHVLKQFYAKDIWLISDRINKADDNGEAFFKYLHDNKLHKDSYFVIQNDSEDFKIVNKYGRILNYRSLKHRLIHLMASMVISSAGDDYVFCPFYNRNFYKDILWKQKRVFLQHGIIKDDLADWLNRYNKNLDIFITSSSPEFNSILKGNYFYGKDVVKMTGLARYDCLTNNSKKYISIMPTWRASLTRSADYVVTGKEAYDDSFIDSNFFKFYNDLINDERLIKCASENGYRIKFMPHPRVITYIDKFKHNELIEFCDITTKYRDIFSQSSLVLTDYSSVAFDFAYLRKPVLYAQFDKEEFFEGQVYDQGYFDYERDGFGEVEYDLESTVNRLIAYMEAGCQLKDKYRKRIDKFFAFNDTKNCERIYKEIIRL